MEACAGASRGQESSERTPSFPNTSLMGNCR
jgi:hypothetical protein